MRVGRLAIIGVLTGEEVKDKETEEGAYALLGRCTERSPNMEWTLKFVRLGGTPGAQAWNPQEDKETGGQASGYFENSPADLGVYVLAHGSMAGLAGVVDVEKFYVMLQHFGLLSLRKLCLIACVSAGEAIVEGVVHGNPSTLYKICKYMGEKGCKPVMAGWNSFVTVVNTEMFGKSEADGKPFLLGTATASVKKNKGLLDPADHAGRKALDGPRTAKILASNPASKSSAKKLFYVFKDGATRVTHADWTDK
ncbi:hypothetical protein HNQ60_005149 [Povalibacter uvarum]|uniref:Uncharacterized protein n=1 Tax=Povalibacter uvarum TaxID=732238 RepID=A0A841HSE6_9GAMM|nr:hypothetical protein [Povalibacter uvarum]MBB6096227.1 hypothetical protein [Povalibacter uvarum]